MGRKNWQRSNDYRKQFFMTYHAPFRCRYCNRKLSAKDLEVDHIIPVNRASNSFLIRCFLKLLNINDVNDVRNLAPACRKCNRKKGKKIGLWTIRGWLGKYKIYWVSLYAAIAFIILLIAGFFITQNFFSIPISEYIFTWLKGCLLNLYKLFQKVF